METLTTNNQRSRHREQTKENNEKVFFLGRKIESSSKETIAFQWELSSSLPTNSQIDVLLRFYTTVKKMLF